ncbi:DUF1194 domain-containing protein [Algicella marina]|uniref:DUF1194 domain-containing protein n=1 Tax=Algicella marina TaxID=2683284 RepID=A0A6P1SXL7_9RHOB|nr:DUF1194 domain-containing protein [Algicella marina]QHQ34295.1 DUF1194 domain-containing protein [Algicella marina]
MRPVLLLLLLALVVPVRAEAQACRLALVLALDVSSSVDSEERHLQLEGVAQALEDREVRNAFVALPGTSVALLVFEWSGQQDQSVLQDWVDISSVADLDRVARQLRLNWPRRANRPTALGYALDFARRKLTDRAYCFDWKVDVSGDGRNNDGLPPDKMYKWQDYSGITVNALAVGHQATDLAEYFETTVIRGPGAFVMEATDYDDFARAIRKKLVRELGVPKLGLAGN